MNTHIYSIYSKNNHKYYSCNHIIKLYIYIYISLTLGIIISDIMTSLILIIVLSEASALIGFDCGGQNLNVTTVSLLDVGECDLKIRKPNTSSVHIQLLQLSDYSHTEVIQCKIEISRTIFHCGMHSHISAVHNGKADYVHETGHSQCMRMFQDGSITLAEYVLILGIKANQTMYRRVTLRGRLQVDGYCKGAQYSDPYGTWDNVVVQAFFFF